MSGPHQQSIGYWDLDRAGIKCPIRSGLNLEEAGINSGMTHTCLDYVC